MLEILICLISFIYTIKQVNKMLILFKILKKTKEILGIFEKKIWNSKFIFEI